MGVIALLVAILPRLSIGGRELFFAEAPGPSEDKVSPQIRGTAALLWRPLLLGEVLFDRDVHAVWYAQTEVFVRTLLEGSWPTWNRSVGFGHSLVGNPNRQVFYPPNWLNLLLPPWLAYTLLTGFHLLLAGAGALTEKKGPGTSWESVRTG